MKKSSYLARITIVYFLSIWGVLSAEEQKIEIRVLVHGLVGVQPELFVPNEKGKLSLIDTVPKDLSETIVSRISDNVLPFHKEQEIDPENPGKGLLARVKVPSSCERAIVVLFPSSDKEGELFRGLVIDDSPSRFEFGESCLVNASNYDVAISAGENRVGVKPWNVEIIEPVQKTDEFNMAQVDFVFRAGSDKSWKPFSQRRTKFVKSQRRVFLVSATKGSSSPSVSTIVDLLPLELK